MLIIIHHLILIIKKNDFLILGEKDTFGSNGSFGASEKNNNGDNNGDNSYLFVNGK